MRAIHKIQQRVCVNVYTFDLRSDSIIKIENFLKPASE